MSSGGGDGQHAQTGFPFPFFLLSEVGLAFTRPQEETRGARCML